MRSYPRIFSLRKEKEKKRVWEAIITVLTKKNFCRRFRVYRVDGWSAFHRLRAENRISDLFFEKVFFQHEILIERDVQAQKDIDHSGNHDRSKDGDHDRDLIFYRDNPRGTSKNLSGHHAGQ